MRIATAAFASTVALLLAQAASADKPRLDLRASGDRFDRPQLERPGRPERVEGVRPDGLRALGNSIDGGNGAPRGITSNVRIADGRPALMPNARRDQMLPVDESTGQMRGMPSHVRVAHGRPNLMPNARRDQMLPVDEDTGFTRGIPSPSGVRIAHGRPQLMPNARRDQQMPVDEITGMVRGVQVEARAKLDVLMRLARRAATNDRSDDDTALRPCTSRLGACQ